MGPNTFDLNELAALFALLRRNGVTSFEHSGLKIELGEPPTAETAEQHAEFRKLPNELRGLPSEYFDPALGIGIVVK